MDCDLDNLAAKLNESISAGSPEEIQARLTELVFGAVVASVAYWGVWNEERRAEVTRLVQDAREALKGSPYEHHAGMQMERIPLVSP